MAETQKAKLARYREALEHISRMPDGAEPWVIVGYADDVLRGRTIKEAVATEEQHWSEAGSALSPGQQTDTNTERQR